MAVQIDLLVATADFPTDPNSDDTPDPADRVSPTKSQTDGLRGVPAGVAAHESSGEDAEFDHQLRA
jgi:hypothetical protein